MGISDYGQILNWLLKMTKFLGQLVSGIGKLKVNRKDLFAVENDSSFI
jgi:hypothetical protein